SFMGSMAEPSYEREGSFTTSKAAARSEHSLKAGDKKCLMLRSERREHLEAWIAGKVCVDHPLRSRCVPPYGEVVRANSARVRVRRNRKVKVECQLPSGRPRGASASRTTRPSPDHAVVTHLGQP